MSTQQRPSASRSTPAPAPALRSANPLDGVYRYRRLIDGCRAWYMVKDGVVGDFVVVRDPESEARVVADLVRDLRGIRPGLELHTPMLSLIKPSRASS